MKSGIGSELREYGFPGGLQYHETVVSICHEQDSNCTCDSRTASVSSVLYAKKKKKVRC